MNSGAVIFLLHHYFLYNAFAAILTYKVDVINT